MNVGGLDETTQAVSRHVVFFLLCYYILSIGRQLLQLYRIQLQQSLPLRLQTAPNVFHLSP